MKRMKPICKGAALLLAAALLTLPLLGLAAPVSAQAGPVGSSTVSGSDAPTVGDSDATPTESGEPAPEPPACFCDVKCTTNTLNADCPACVADVSKCAGKEPEPAPPVCSCSVKCAAGAVNVDCPVCKTDLTGCVGKASEPTTPPEPNYTITILSPSGWYTKAADVEIRVEDVNGTGWQKVEYKIERGGSWIDLTDDLTDTNRAKVEITENCTLYVTVTDKDGKAHSKSRYIECFDRTAPTVKAGIDVRLLRVEASDELSGVDAVYIDGDRYGDLTNGTLDVRLRDLGDDYKQLSVQAVDNAGNKSKTVQLNNPNYKEPEKDKDEDKKPSSSCPDTTKPTTTPTPTPTTTPTTTTPAPAPSTGTTTGTTPRPSGTAGGTSGGASTSKPTGGTSSQPVTERDPSPLTPDGQATVVDDATDEDGKEFYTIVTPAENTFYLVIDKQRDSDNVYFLNAVTESDLLALAEKDDGTGGTPEAAIPEPEKCSCKELCEPGAVNTDCPVCKLDLSGCAGEAPEAPPADGEPEAQKPAKENNTGAVVLAVLVALAAGGAGYYFKVVKPKKELDDADDFEDIQFEDDPAADETDAVPDGGRLPEPEDYEDDPDDPDEYGPAAEDEDGDELTGDGDPEDREGGL